MGIPAEHAVYLQRKDYAPPWPDQFTSEELTLLARFGHWMEALVKGAIVPVTPEQNHFLAAAQGQAAPETPFERVWTKLRKLQPIAAPPERSENVPPPEPKFEPPLPGSAVEAKFEEFAEARHYLADLRQQTETAREEILKVVRTQLEALEAQAKPELEEAERAVAELEAELRAEIIKTAKNVQWDNLQVTYYMGKVTWDDKWLLKYAENHPELMRYRKVGKPWVAIRHLEK